MRAYAWIAALMLVAGPAAAQTDDMDQLTGEDMILATGADLVELCGAGEASTEALQAVSFCYGFLEGVYNVHEALAASDGIRLVCPPEGTTREAAAATFVAWSEAHPDSLDQPALDVVFRSWMADFPCPRAN